MFDPDAAAVHITLCSAKKNRAWGRRFPGKQVALERNKERKE